MPLMIQACEPSKASCHLLCLQMQLDAAKSPAAPPAKRQKDNLPEYSTPDSFTERRRKHHNVIGPVSGLTPNCPSQLATCKNKVVLSIAHFEGQQATTLRDIKILLDQSPDAHIRALKITHAQRSQSTSQQYVAKDN